MLRVVTPPEPIVTPADVPGSHSSADPAITAMIAAVTAEIDGPMGWVGRALGLQTLELRQECWPTRHYRLPCPPIVDIVSVKYLDADDTEQTVDSSNYGATAGFLYFKSTWSRPALSCLPFPVIINFRAGYNGASVDDGGTGGVPAQAKQAVILAVQNMRSMSKEDLFLRAEEVEGVGRTEYTVSDQASKLIRSATDSLLSGLRVFS